MSILPNFTQKTTFVGLCLARFCQFVGFFNWGFVSSQQNNFSGWAQQTPQFQLHNHQKCNDSRSWSPKLHNQCQQSCFSVVVRGQPVPDLCISPLWQSPYFSSTQCTPGSNFSFVKIQWFSNLSILMQVSWFQSSLELNKIAFCLKKKRKGKCHKASQRGIWELYLHGKWIHSVSHIFDYINLNVYTMKHIRKTQ